MEKSGFFYEYQEYLTYWPINIKDHLLLVQPTHLHGVCILLPPGAGIFTSPRKYLSQGVDNSAASCNANPPKWTKMTPSTKTMHKV